LSSREERLETPQPVQRLLRKKRMKMSLKKRNAQEEKLARRLKLRGKERGR
jgi:hypothetical protein